MTDRKLGIWMDHEQAHLTEFTQDPMKTITLFSKFNHAGKRSSLVKGESHMHSAQQHQEGEYYKSLGDKILQYREVVIFGPTQAKNELVNTLRADHRFSQVKISLETADKMTDSQAQAFVRKYFTRH